MIRVTLGELANIVDGVLVGPDAEVTGSVETDSRLVSAGGLFIAKPGEVTDGHNFVDAATSAGAIGAIVQRKLDDCKIGQVVVADSVVALGKLAGWLISELKSVGKLKVVAVTGSNGKTSTKNMLRAVLSQFGQVIAPIESYNNEVGAPISMLKADFETDFLVVELGAGGQGSIKYLTKMCQPDIGVVLKVGLAHVGEFGGIENTFKIKSELVQELAESTVVLLNKDDSYVEKMAELTAAKKVWFGTSSSSDVRASEISLALDGTRFTFKIGNAIEHKVTLKILGEHQVMNALAALGVANILSLDIDKAITALENLELAERWRMQPLPGPNGTLIINDAYNASPDSMKAALQSLATLGRSGHRTIAVLGEMAELGSDSGKLHDEIGRFVVRLNIDRLIVVGERAKLIHLGAMQEGSWADESKFVDTIDEAFDEVNGLLMTGDIVLVKSSKSADLRYLGDRLAEVTN